MAFPNRLNVAPKHCAKHNLTYDVGNCSLCDVENGTGILGRFAKSASDGERADMAKQMRIENQARVGQIRSGYRGDVRAQYLGLVGEQFGVNFEAVSKASIRLAEALKNIEIVPEPVVKFEVVGEEELHPTKRKFRNIA